MIFDLKKREIQNCEETACQKVVAMVTSKLIDKDLLRQIVPKFGGLSLLGKKGYNVQSPCGENSPPPPPPADLNRVLKN